MDTTGIAGVDSSIQKTTEWLRDVKAELGWDDEARAYQALRGTLHALRDRLPAGEAVHLAAEMPMLIRGLYFEGGSRSAAPSAPSRTSSTPSAPPSACATPTQCPSRALYCASCAGTSGPARSTTS